MEGWNVPGRRTGEGKGLVHKSVAAFLGVILWSCIGGVPAAAASPPVLSPVHERESPFLSALLDYSARGSRDLLGLPVDPSLPEREMTRLADRLRPEVVGAAAGGHVVSAFRRVLLVEERFTYDKSSADPGNYLLESVLVRRKGNCLGLSLLYLALADRLGIPFRGVYVPSHCFVRYEGNGVRVNVEFAEGGASWEDDRYRREFRIPPARPYLHSLAPTEMLGVYLKTLGAGYSRKGRYDEAIAEARRAVELEPWNAAARGNLAAAYCGCGRLDEGIREYRMAVGIDPGNRRLQSGLERAYFSRGSPREALP